MPVHPTSHRHRHTLNPALLAVAVALSSSPVVAQDTAPTPAPASEEKTTTPPLDEAAKKARDEAAKEKEAEQLNGLIPASQNAKITFRAPAEPGAYRLFVRIQHNQTVAYANIPFQVLPQP